MLFLNQRHIDVQIRLPVWGTFSVHVVTVGTIS